MRNGREEERVVERIVRIYGTATSYAIRRIVFFLFFFFSRGRLSFFSQNRLRIARSANLLRSRFFCTCVRRSELAVSKRSRQRMPYKTCLHNGDPPLFRAYFVDAYPLPHCLHLLREQIKKKTASTMRKTRLRTNVRYAPFFLAFASNFFYLPRVYITGFLFFPRMNWQICSRQLTHL